MYAIKCFDCSNGYKSEELWNDCSQSSSSERDRILLQFKMLVVFPDVDVVVRSAELR